MAETVERLPYALSERAAEISAKATQMGGRAIDYAIAGIPFLNAISDQTPYIDQTADMQKEQRDEEPEPGEQTLAGWWLRSQDSWHSGAGNKFMEARGDVTPSTRFYDSRGVDVWTPGQLSLLRAMVESSADDVAASCCAAVGEDLYLGVGPDVKKVSVDGTTVTTLANSGGSNVTDIAASTDDWYAITADGHVLMGDSAGAGSVTVTLTDAVAGVGQLAWAKHRLFAAIGNSIYVVDPAAEDASSATAIYTHPDSNWTYTCIAEGPSAVYLSGYSGAESAVQKIAIDSSTGDLPDLTTSSGVTTAVLPPGERISRMAVLAGQFVALGTSKGLRVGVVGDGADITYGPLFLAPDDVVDCTAVACWDRFFYVAFRTSSAQHALCYRVDVSNQVADGEFAYAADAEVGDDGYISDLTVCTPGDRLVACLASGTYPNESPDTFYAQSADTLVASGWIDFGRIRYRTTEPKTFRWLTVEAEPLAGTITVDAITAGESTARVIVYNVAGQGVLDQAAIPINLGPLRQLGLKFTLQADQSDDTSGPTVHSWQVKAMPAPKPQRKIQLPLRCFDVEAWYTGQEAGFDGWAVERFSAIKSLESSGQLALLQDFTSRGGATGQLVQVTSSQFVQTAAADATTRRNGGLLILQLTTMD